MGSTWIAGPLEVMPDWTDVLLAANHRPLSYRVHGVEGVKDCVDVEVMNMHTGQTRIITVTLADIKRANEAITTGLEENVFAEGQRLLGVKLA